MKKLMLLVVLLSALMVSAQNFGKVGVAVVPNADVIGYFDQGKAYDTELSRQCLALNKKIEKEEWYKAAENDNEDFTQLKKACENFAKALNIQPDECFVSKTLFSVAFNGLFSAEGEPDFSLIDAAIALELKKPLDVTALLKALNDLLAGIKDEEVKENVRFNAGIYGGYPTLTATLNDDEIPAAFKKITIAILEPTVILIAPEKSAKAAIDRAKAGKVAAFDPFFNTIKDDSFVAVRMMPEIAKAIAGMGNDETPAWGTIAKGAGFAITCNVSNVIKTSVNAYLNTAAEATLVKTQIWDAQFGPMVGMFAPGVKQNIGAELPLLNTIAGTANKNVFGISVNISLEDIKAFIDIQKKAFEGKKAAPAAPAAAPVE